MRFIKYFSNNPYLFCTYTGNITSQEFHRCYLEVCFFREAVHVLNLAGKLPRSKYNWWWQRRGLNILNGQPYGCLHFRRSGCISTFCHLKNPNLKEKKRYCLFDNGIMDEVLNSTCSSFSTVKTAVWASTLSLVPLNCLR